jgi:hypothetical protein
MTAPAIGARVRCHKNLHRGDWSITVSGKVVANVAEICLADCKPVYWRNGHAKIIAASVAGKPRRRVVAWIDGTVCAAPSGARTAIAYNPYRYKPGDIAKFETRAGAEVTHCAAIHFTACDGAVAIGAVR